MPQPKKHFSHYPLVWGILLLLAVACKEKTQSPSLETRVQGQVLVWGTQQTAVAAPLVVKAYREYTLVHEPWRPLYKVMAETQTDSFGFFELNFTADDLSSSYYLAHETPVPRYFDPTFQRVSIQAGQEQQRRLEFLPHSWLRLRVTNVNPNINNRDELRIFISPTARYSFTGPYTRQAIAMLPGNQSYTALCTLIRNDQINPFQFTMALTAQDTTFHAFDY
jgi:hypothetical protein